MTTSSAPRSLPGWRNQLASISSPMPTGWPSWVTVPSKHCGCGAQDYEKAGKAWDQHRLPTCTHRFRAIDVHVRSANRAVAAAGQRRRRYRSQCPSLGSTLAQPRRHLSTRPHLPIRNGIGRDGIGAANTQRGGGFVANRHRVAVTVRTATFYTRTKIRKLQAPSTDPDVITAAARHVLDLFELDRPVRLLECG